MRECSSRKVHGSSKSKSSSKISQKIAGGENESQKNKGGAKTEPTQTNDLKKESEQKEKSSEEKKAMKRILKQMFVNTTNFHFFDRSQKMITSLFNCHLFGKSERNLL